MTAAINQKAYLQKYLNGPSGDKKKKKKKAIKGKGFKIIDDDIDLSKLRPLDGDELDILDGGEDAPQIAGIIDERPEELKKQEEMASSSKWRVISQDDGFNSKLQIQEIKRDIKETTKENEIIFGKMYSDSEDEKQDSDASPPRKKSSNKNEERKEPKSSKKHNSDSDFSPPRRKEKENATKTKKRDKKYDSDPSPPRTKSKPREKIRKPSRWGDADREEIPEISKSSKRMSPSSDQSPPRKLRKNYDSDASPPRKTQKKYDSDASPPRKSQKIYDSDASSPRKSRKETYRNRSQEATNRKQSPGRSSYRTNESRNIRPYNTDSDPRKSHHRQKSPQRKRYESDSDASPPRKGKDRKEGDKRYKRNSESPPPSNKKMAKTLEGKKAGLQDAKQLREENESFRKREEEVYNKMTDDVSGRNAQAVSRKGKRDTSEDRQKQREKAERQKELDEKYKMWSRGIKQIEDQESRYKEYMHEANKPLARHKDDRDLENNLKEIERDGDPMLQYIREKKRERGELGPERPTYKGNFPPNRFNLRPGYRWDGVDRSNGYEKKYFTQQSKKKAQEEEAYKWSTEDL